MNVCSTNYPLVPYTLQLVERCLSIHGATEDFCAKYEHNGHRRPHRSVMGVAFLPPACLLSALLPATIVCIQKSPGCLGFHSTFPGRSPKLQRNLQPGRHGVAPSLEDKVPTLERTSLTHCHITLSAFPGRQSPNVREDIADSLPYYTQCLPWKTKSQR